MLLKIHSQACRVNLAFPDLVCDHMMDKALHNINCADVSSRQDSLMLLGDNLTNFSIATYGNDTVEDTDTSENLTNFNRANHDFEMEVCRAERESQKLGSTISAYIAPFGKDAFEWNELYSFKCVPISFRFCYRHCTCSVCRKLE